MSVSEVLVLIPSHSLEDFPSELGEKPAGSLLNAFAVAWHPACLLETRSLPRWHRADDQLVAQSDRLVIVPMSCDESITSEWVRVSQSTGAKVVRGYHERGPMLAATLTQLENSPPIDADLANDFMALGTCWLWTELLTRHMRNYASLDEVRMKDEILAAAEAAIAGDAATTRTHLKHAFELLLEGRERFYPVPCYLLDLCLAGPSVNVPALEALLNDTVPTNILLMGQDLEELVRNSPAFGESLRTAVARRRVELIGGDWREGPTHLSSVNAILGSLQRGRRSYIEQVGQPPVTWGRRRFGVNLAMPQFLNRAGFRGGLHFVMDDGLYPDDEQSRLRWQGQDGSVLEAFSRIPLAGDSASSFLRLPVRLAESMDHDHVAAVCFARWPDLRTPWLDDLRRMARYAPVLGSFITFDEFFQSTDTRDRYHDQSGADYLSPFLVQAVARQEPDPIRRYARSRLQRMRLERAEWCQHLAQLLCRQSLTTSSNELENRLDQSGPDIPETPDATLDADLAARESQAVAALQPLLTGATARPGVVVVNTLSFARRTLVEWPGGLGFPTIGGSVVSIASRAESSAVLVDLPPSGFVWLPADGAPPQPITKPQRSGAWAEDLALGNEFCDLRISELTGGLMELRTPTLLGNRLSQQLAYRYPTLRTVKSGEGDEAVESTTYYSVMQRESHRVIESGPEQAAVETTGQLVDPQNLTRSLATFRQLIRIGSGRPLIEIEFEITPAKPLEGEPWTNYFAARWAWKNEEAALTKGVLQVAQPVLGERIEAPDYLEIADGQGRLALLAPGTPFHRRTGPRMLDTLLLVAGESTDPQTIRIALDQPFPMQASLSSLTPPLVIPVTHGPPASGESGWFFHIGAKNVVLLRLLPTPTGAPGCVVRLLETEGRAKAFKLTAFQTPATARQIDLQGQTMSTLGIDADGGVILEIAAYEVLEVELTW